MRIAVVTPSFPTRAEPYRGAPVWATLRHLARMAELRVFCTYARYPVRLRQHRDFIHARPALEAYRGVVESETVDFPAVPLLTRGVNAWTLARRLAQPIARFRPELVLTYWIYPEGDAGTRVAHRLGIPSVIVSLGSDLKRIPGAFVRRRTAAAVRTADRVITVSRDLASVAVGLGARSEHVRAVFNGVETGTFRIVPREQARQALALPADERIALYVGRLVPLKRVGRLVEALTHAPGWNLALIGNGSEGHALREQVARLGLGGRVRFLGARGAEDVATWMNAADTVCLVSESEGQPNVLVEAMHCGRPVVATGVGGIPEIVGEGDGVLLADAEPGRIAAALERIARTAWDREGIAARHRRSWEDAARETMEICREAAERR